MPAAEERLVQLIKFGTMKRIREHVNNNPTMDLHYPTWHSTTPLTTAIDRSDPMIVGFLIDKLPTDLNSTLTQACGRTALMHAARCAKNPEILSVLIKKGADVSKTDVNGWSCLFYAVVGERLSNLAALLDCGLSIEAADRDGRTPLMISVYLASYEVFSGLLARQADPNAVDRHGLNALHLAIIRRRRDCVLELSSRRWGVVERPSPFTGTSTRRLREEIMLDMLPSKRRAYDECEHDDG
ncbi:putative ankyrin repeat domain-containing protein 30B-like [Phymastichus coffea]|uniref:putative ankyrin repeat domain-containing protein 30B-like n=1 Tax=Phymastichus coffea TaxID=108790 RepID=UPI00273C5A7B|nr:putative ankyrin repeat domain-containing protein 30B-like [Phymastichus coffea]